MGRPVLMAAAITLAAFLLTAAELPMTAQEGKTVRADLAPVAARQTAPDFALPDAKGTVLRLSGYRGKVVLLDFWATTCGGCVEEIPTFVELAQAYEAKGLATVGVSEDIPYAQLSGSDEAWARVRTFVKDHKVSYPVVVGDERVTAAYAISALPLTYLIDREGRVAAIYRGVVNRASLLTNLDALLAE